MTSPHPAIRHWQALEGAEPGNFLGTDEPMSLDAPLSQALGLTSLGIHHMRVPPGRRTSLPHAESHEEEFVHVIEGHPDVWLDGVLYRLRPGDSVGFPAGTGLAHTFINNTDSDVRLLVVGNSDLPDNRIIYPVNPERKTIRKDWWHDAPVRALGAHDGLPDARRRMPGQKDSPDRKE